jgi:hypothetical protein
MDAVEAKASFGNKAGLRAALDSAQSAIAYLLGLLDIDFETAKAMVTKASPKPEVLAKALKDVVTGNGMF